MNKNRPAIILGILLITVFSGVFISTGQAATTVNTSMSEISITPNPVGFGYQITATGIISPQPPAGYSYRAILLAIIDSNGNYRTISSNSTQPGSGTFVFN